MFLSPREAGSTNETGMADTDCDPERTVLTERIPAVVERPNPCGHTNEEAWIKLRH